MLQKKTVVASWGINLSDKQAALLRGYLGDEHNLYLHSTDDLSSLQECTDEEETPCLFWISSRVSRTLHTMSPAEKRWLEQAPKALLLDEDYSLADFEAACDLGITDIVRPPYARKHIAAITRRAIELRFIHHDMDCMAREILLERELLERKNELLNFLVNFLSNTTESLDLQYILQNAYSGFSTLLPLRSMHAALWEREGTNPHSVALHICAPEGSTAHEIWRESLLDQARYSIGLDFSVGDIQKLELHDQEQEWRQACPEDGTVLRLPIIHGQEQLGVLMLLTSMDRHLGRDQATALDSAMRHFAMSIKNARRFQRMQLHADYDALTKIHSRRHFEQKLEEEMQHFVRYGQSLSLIMLDIDHFKQINDNRGHYVGDIVLREVASLISSTIRTTDYCARFGGEEFVILLPHTGSKKSMILAERMRKTIAEHTFIVDGGEPLELTASLGLASVNPGSQKNKHVLLQEADAALYAAKASGRNCTRENAA